MGVGISAASAILFTTFVLMFATVFVAVDDLKDSVIDAELQHYDTERYLDDVSISIVSVNITEREIVLLNNGGVCIDFNDIEVLLNGTCVTDFHVTLNVQGAVNTVIWGPGESVTIDLNRNIDGMRIKISAMGESPVYYTT